MTSNRSFRWQAHWDKVLFILAGLYFLSVLWWLVEQNQIRLPFIIESKSTENPVESISEDDKAFIAYLKARLATIEAQQLEKEKISSSVSSSPTLQGNLPTVAISPPPLPQPTQATQPQPQPTAPAVVERVYIPIYPDSTQPAPQAVAPSPSPSPIPAPPPLTVDSVPVLTPGAELLPSQTALSLASENKLVGTLPSGDRSYAIFKLEGTAHHVRIGQFIGQTGWILVNVEGQEITLQKNGQQRTMSVGSQFQ